MPEKKASLLTAYQAAPLLLEEWKYHNSMFFQAIYRYGLAEVFVAIAPFLIPGLIKDLGSYVFLFPVFAIILAVAATFHLQSLSIYVSKSDINYRKVMGNYAPKVQLGKDEENEYRRKWVIRLLEKIFHFIEDTFSLQSATQQLVINFFILSLLIQFANFGILVSFLNKP